MERNKCYTVQDLQDILRVSRVSISKLLKKKEFRWIRLDGGQYRISRKSFDEWLDGGIEEDMAEGRDDSVNPDMAVMLTTLMKTVAE